MSLNIDVFHDFGGFWEARWKRKSDKNSIQKGIEKVMKKRRSPRGHKKAPKAKSRAKRARSHGVATPPGNGFWTESESPDDPITRRHGAADPTCGRAAYPSPCFTRQRVGRGPGTRDPRPGTWDHLG